MSPLTEPTKLTLAKGQPVPNDPYFAFNSLLLHGNGTNGSTVITDSSGSPKTVIPVGNAQISTAQSKFGSSSIAFDGTGDYLTAPDSSAFDIPGDFTIEAWVRVSASVVMGIVGKQRGVVNFGEYAFYINASRQLGFAATTGGESSSSWTLVSMATVASLSLNQWSHVAITRQGSSFTLWIDGVSSASATASGAITDGTSLLSVGSLKDDGSFSFNGYIDDLRITKGVARYTSNFTPPTAPFPDF